MYTLFYVLRAYAFMLKFITFATFYFYSVIISIILIYVAFKDPLSPYRKFLFKKGTSLTYLVMEMSYAHRYSNSSLKKDKYAFLYTHLMLIVILIVPLFIQGVPL